MNSWTPHSSSRGGILSFSIILSLSLSLSCHFPLPGARPTLEGHAKARAAAAWQGSLNPSLRRRRLQSKIPPTPDWLADLDADNWLTGRPLRWQLTGRPWRWQLTDWQTFTLTTDWQTFTLTTDWLADLYADNWLTDLYADNWLADLDTDNWLTGRPLRRWLTDRPLRWQLTNDPDCVNSMCFSNGMDVVSCCNLYLYFSLIYIWPGDLLRIFPTFSRHFGRIIIWLLCNKASAEDLCLFIRVYHCVYIELDLVKRKR